MPENILTLRKRAADAGMKDAKTAKREEMEAFLTKREKANPRKAAAAPAKKAAGKAAPARKSNSKSSGKAAPAKATPPKKAASTKSPAKSTSKSGTAKRTPSAAKANNGAADLGVGRAMIDVKSLDFKGYDTDAWKPREGKSTAIFFKALVRAKGNVEKAAESLTDQLNTLVPAKAPDGTKRTMEQRRSLLRFNLNRTLWRFAMATGQHTKGGNRHKYGTGDYANGNGKKAPGKKAAPAKAKSKRAPAKAGRSK